MEIIERLPEELVMKIYYDYFHIPMRLEKMKTLLKDLGKSGVNGTHYRLLLNCIRITFQQPIQIKYFFENCHLFKKALLYINKTEWNNEIILDEVALKFCSKKMKERIFPNHKENSEIFMLLWWLEYIHERPSEFHEWTTPIQSVI